MHELKKMTPGFVAPFRERCAHLNLELVTSASRNPFIFFPKPKGKDNGEAEA